MDCIFCDIVQKKTETSIIYEDEKIIVFDDLYPEAPVHILLIPKTHIETLNDLNEGDQHLISHLFLKAKDLATEFGIDKTGYRTLINCNKDGGQLIFHLHLHLLGGRTLTWPPG